MMIVKDKNEKLITTMRIFLGLVIWVAILKLYAYFIAPHVNIRMPEILSMAISSMIVPYAIALPIFSLVIRGVPVNEFKNPNKKLTKAELIKLIIIQSGISILIMFIVNMIIMMSGYENGGLSPDSIKKHILFFSFMLLIFAPIVEEIMFRKIILGRLIKWGEKYAILVSAICFALPHFFSQGIAGMFYTFILGCIWAYITIETGNITLAILLHSFSNLWGMFLPMLLLSSKIGMVVYMLIWILIMPCIAIILLVRERKNIKNIIKNNKGFV